MLDNVEVLVVLLGLERLSLFVFIFVAKIVISSSGIPRRAARARRVWVRFDHLFLLSPLADSATLAVEFDIL